MHRRLLIAAMACAPAARLFAQDSPPLPHQKIPARELHDALSARFPVRFGIEGVFAVQVDAPRLLLLPARQQVGATLQVRLAGETMQRVEAGELDVVFALRYEASDRTLRAHDLQVLDLRWPGLPPETVQMLSALLPELAREAVGEIVLHRFTQRELALPDAMGFEPGRIEVIDDGLVLWFRPKPPR